MTLTWSIRIYWPRFVGDTTPAAVEEVGRLLSISTMRGKKTVFGNTGFTRAQPGTLTIDLDNYDGRFDAWNTASALYPNVHPDVLVILLASSDGGTNYDGVFHGRIKSIIPNTGNKTVRIVVEDAWRWVMNNEANVDLTAGANTATLIHAVVASAGYIQNWSAGLEISPDTIPYYWTSGKPAYDALNELNESELGQLFVTESGDFAFISRHYTYSATSAATLTQAEILKGIYLPQPWDNIRNLVKAKAHPRTLQSLQVLWTLQDIPPVSPGQSITIYTPYSYAGKPVPGYAVVGPVANTDYTMNTASTGASTDLTASFAVVQTKYGDTSELVVTNNHASLIGYVTLLQVRGQPLDTPDPIEVMSNKSGVYQPRILSLDLPWVQNFNIAKDFADYLCDKLQDPEAYPVIQLEGRYDIQFAHDLYTKITLQIAKLGIDGDYFIIGIEHKSSGEGCQKITTTYYLEPTEAVSAWTFPTNIGTTSILAY